MTEITEYRCDMCAGIQRLNTFPLRYETNYKRIEGMGAEKIPRNLCPDCADIVFDFIKQRRNMLSDEKEEAGSL